MAGLFGGGSGGGGGANSGAERPKTRTFPKSLAEPGRGGDAMLMSRNPNLFRPGDNKRAPIVKDPRKPLEVAFNFDPAEYAKRRNGGGTVMGG